jgi:hypothetical protein
MTEFQEDWSQNNSSDKWGCHDLGNFQRVEVSARETGNRDAHIALTQTLFTLFIC